MFNMLKKTAKFFGKGMLYSGLFSIFPLVFVGFCCSKSRGGGGHGMDLILKCIGVFCAVPALILTAVTLPLGIAGVAIALAGFIVICPLAAVGDCIAAAIKSCTADRNAAPAAHAAHHHVAHDIENPPPPSPASHAAIIANLQQNQRLNNADQAQQLDAFSKYTQDYVDNFNDKKSHTETITAMKLNEQEQKLLEKYLDPITGDVMDIPVMLNEKVYNLLTLQEILARDRKDPYNRVEFTLRDIQPARSMEEEIKNTLKQIEENRENKNANKAAEKSPSRKNSNGSINLSPKPA